MVQDECHRWSLIGLASWGEGCGTTKFPGVYTRVSHFMEWILSETMDSMTCDAFNEPILYPNLKECGIPSYRFLKTGILVRALSYPWVADIYYGKEYLGSGVLVNSTVVLTTTSVINPWGFSLKARHLLVSFGSPARFKNASDYTFDTVLVKQVLFHPMANHRFDLCLLVLGVAMADSLIKFHPICFSHFKIPFFVGDAVQLGVYTGGPLHDFKISDGILLKMSECKSHKGDAFKKYRSKCMKINRHYGSGSSVCQFDKGAVVMQEIEGRFYLLGLSSYAISCAAARVFYDVNWAFEWISVLSTLLATE
ncbi:uncharacterized protein CDAR_463401 [Caerostris darwini]|uniref:Peptidase S1 domain-containing protein n=1 Tax=Caerostris darwini TaxID=1538125 RepID=A0AAV4VEP6_9ARAC|nr:uncharacterized protein CDAR_463401 [Caerostris darwini]